MGVEQVRPEESLADPTPLVTDPVSGERQVVIVGQSLRAKNDLIAAENRKRFRDRGLLVLNVLSSPGSGKTALWERTLSDLKGRFRAGVIVGDLATDNDARRFRRAGVEVVQVTTGTVCHLEAAMVDRAAAGLALDGPGLLVIENVGNLVCPANFDLGEDLRVVLLSVTEGEDKPVKYPTIFRRADVVIITKTDLAAATCFDRAAAMESIGHVAPQAVVFEVSVRNGAGLPGWYAYLERRFGEERS